MAKLQFDLGTVEPAFHLSYITLTLKKTAVQQAALEQLLQQQQDPASPNYHDWLTPEEYADRFGLSQNDLDKISDWLRSEGFSVEYVARGRNWLAFSGTAEQVRAAFHTEVHRYRVEGETHFAAAAEPWVPAMLEPVVAGFLGLDDFYPKAPNHPLPAITASDGTHALVPDDLATIYDLGKLYTANIKGSSQRIVVVGQSAINTSDIRGFRNQFNLPSLNLQVILYGGSDPGTTSDMGEADIDLEWAGAVAQNAALIYVYGANFGAAALYATDNNLAPVISMSFGACEASNTSVVSSVYRSEAQKANAEGITWLAGSGDTGAATCDQSGSSATRGLAVSFPASMPEVTAVGGTEFNEGSGKNYWNVTNGPNFGSAESYIPEMAWNETSVGKGLAATGGGASSLYPKPAWQTGLGVPSDGARDLPDISLAAGVFHDPCLFLMGGTWYSAGGTSVSTAAFAGIVALLNQYLVMKGVQSQPGAGNINPTLYHLAQSAPNAFHDITVGDNIVPCTQGTPNCATGQFGYSAGPGYDLATGLGTVDAYNLVTQWNSSPLTATTTTVTANPTSISTGATTILTATVSASSGSATPTGSVSFTLGSSTLGSANLSGSGGTATASLTVSASQLSAGNNTITASYGGSAGFSASSGSVTVTVSGGVPLTATTTTVTASPASIAVGGSTVLTATVKAGSGSATPTGSVSFTLGGSSLGSANLSGSGGTATASLTVSASQLSTGNNTITASYGGSAGFSGSSGTVTVSVGVSATSTTTTVTASPASIAVGGSTMLTATVQAGSGSATPTGSVSFTLGGSSLGSASLSGSGGTASASLTVSASQLSTGNNTITASYGGSTGFSASSGSVTVTVSGGVPLTSTTTTVTASPASIAVGGSTVLTATVQASSGSTTPTGSVSFTLGNSPLGSASLSGSGGTASASLTVSASQLSSGINTITASYGGSAGFSGSSGTVTVSVGVTFTSTTTTVIASPASIAVGGSTMLTATVKASSGSATPTGSVSFTLRSNSLGSANLSGSGGTATASLTVGASQLSTGINTITASYGGSTGFSASLATVNVTVAPPSVATSVVVPSVTPNPVFQQAPDADGNTFFCTVRLSEIAGTAATLTGFTMAGTDYSSQIQSWFGSASIPANGTISASVRTKPSTVPVNWVFGFSGTDASGATWTQQITVPFLGQQSSASMALSSLPATVALIPDTTHGCGSQYPYYQQLNLQEQNGYEVQLTRYLDGGNDDSSTIAKWFGSWRLAPFGALETGICWSIPNPPQTLSYEVDGTDAAGNHVMATLSVPFQSPAPSPGALSVSESTVSMSAGPSQSAATTVNVNVPSGQPWTVSVFPASQKSGWLVVFPLSGTGPAQVNLVAAAPGLANGVYTTTLVFQSVNTIPQFVNVPVAFTIGASTTTSIGGVANGASFLHAYAPGMILSVFGANLANATQSATALPLPLTMAGVSATINGIAAPLYYVSPQQLNIQVPYEIPTGTALLAVSNNGQVATYSFPVSASAPGIYVGSGNALTPNPSGNRGQVYTLFITGAGEVSPPVATGAGPTGTQVPAPLLPVSLTIGGVTAPMVYMGIPGWSAGNLQINFTVPQNASLGVEPVVVTVGSAASAPANFTVAQ